MAIIRTLSCIRPKPELAGRIASGPHSAMSSEEIRQKIQKNELSYTRIVHPRFLYNDRPKNSDEIYVKAAENLEQWVHEGIMIDDREEGFYLFGMEYQGHSQTGIVARIPVDEILDCTVKAHEKVRDNKLIDLAHHVQLCRAQIGGPILMSYRNIDAVEEWKKKIQEREPLYHFFSENSVWNTIWKAEDKEECAELAQIFAQVPSLYIADGHHRIMSAVKICQDMRKLHPDYTGDEAWNYVTCVCFPDHELRILPYSRMVNDWRSVELPELLEKLKENFDVEPVEEIDFPVQKGEFTMMAEGQGWRLHFHEEKRPAEVPDSLDVAVLQSYVLEPIFGIRNDKKDSRLEFMGGEEQLKKVMDRCYTGSSLGFLMYPTSMGDILQVADNSRTMPPKSTWFSPKMCNGLFIYRIFPPEERKAE